MSGIRPWHEDPECLADLIWWLHGRAPAYDYDNNELFRVRNVSDVRDVLMNPTEFTTEWLAYNRFKAEEYA